jgi:hypothetical protein
MMFSRVLVLPPPDDVFSSSRNYGVALNVIICMIQPVEVVRDAEALWLPVLLTTFVFRIAPVGVGNDPRSKIRSCRAEAAQAHARTEGRLIRRRCRGSSVVRAVASACRPRHDIQQTDRVQTR